MEEATDGEGDETDEVDGDAEVTQDGDADSWQASLVLLLWRFWFFDFCQHKTNCYNKNA